MATVICDAGPLIALALVDELRLLRALFGQVLVPPAVREECLAGGGADAERIRAALDQGWLQVERPGGDREPLSPSLGPGESEAIRLAVALGPEALLVVDDRLARRYALARGVPIVGTVRLLVEAERLGLLEDAGSVVRAMAAHGYRVSSALLERVQERVRRGSV